MKKIGLLGGMSWESTALYYTLINERTRESLGGLHSARCVISSMDFAEIEELQRRGDWHEAGRILAHEATLLAAAGADLLVLCTNTMHKVAEDITDAISIPFLHLADVTANAVIASGISSVGFLGTGFAMSEGFQTDRIASHGLDVRVPEPADQKTIHDIIYSELVLGVIRPRSRQMYQTIIEKMVADGARGIILGCTEIELLIGDDDCSVPVFPTTRLHAEAAIEMAVGS